MLAFLARECGWDKDFIADNFTVDQIVIYYEEIQKQKFKDYQVEAICNVYASATAFGTMKAVDFKLFLERLELTKDDENQVVDKVKAAGLPIEDK